MKTISLKGDIECISDMCCPIIFGFDWLPESQEYTLHKEDSENIKKKKKDLPTWAPATCSWIDRVPISKWVGEPD